MAIGAIYKDGHWYPNTGSQIGATNVTYDNTSSALSSTTVQDAIDEVAANNSSRLLTQEEFNALSDDEKDNGTSYFVTDAISYVAADDIMYDEDTTVAEKFDAVDDTLSTQSEAIENLLTRTDLSFTSKSSVFNGRYIVAIRYNFSNKFNIYRVYINTTTTGYWNANTKVYIGRVGDSVGYIPDSIIFINCGQTTGFLITENGNLYFTPSAAIESGTAFNMNEFIGS